MSVNAILDNSSIKLNAVFFTNFISSLGSCIQVMVLPLWVFHLSNSSELTTLTLFFEYSFMILGSIVFGCIIDRINLRRAYFSGEITKGALIFLLYIYGENYIFLIFVISITSMLNSINQPLVQVLIKNYTPTNKVSNKTSLFSIFMGLSLILGPSLGGLVISDIGLKFAFLINSASFIISSLAFPLITNDINEKITGSLFKGFHSGLKYTLSNANVSLCCFQQLILWVFYGSVQILIPIIIINLSELHEASRYVGYAMGSVGAGFFIGSFTYRHLNKNCNYMKTHTLYSNASALLISIAMISLSLHYKNIYAITSTLAIIGFFLSIFNISNRTNLILSAENSFIGRVSANHRLMMLFGICISSLMTSCLFELNINAGHILLLYGAFMLIIITINIYKNKDLLHENKIDIN